MWQSAEPPGGWFEIAEFEPIPDALWFLSNQVYEAIVGLKDILRADSLSDAALGAAKRIWKRLEKSWGSPAHCCWLEERRKAEYVDPETVAAPFPRSTWHRFHRALGKLRDGLPPEVRTWVDLGSHVAAAAEDPDRIAALQNLLSKMLEDPLLAGLQVDVSTRPPSRHAAPQVPVIEFHERLGSRFLDTSSHSADSRRPYGEEAPPCKKRLAPRDPKREARDKWIYHQVMKGTAYKHIISGVKDMVQKKGWHPIQSIPGIRAAAFRYAKQHGLEPPPRRRNR